MSRTTTVKCDRCRRTIKKGSRGAQRAYMGPLSHVRKEVVSGMKGNDLCGHCAGKVSKLMKTKPSAAELSKMILDEEAEKVKVREKKAEECDVSWKTLVKGGIVADFECDPITSTTISSEEITRLSEALNAKNKGYDDDI